MSHCRWQHPELDPHQLAKDEQAVSSCVVILRDRWINPFEGSSETLVSLSCGITVPEAISSDLLDAHSRGEAAYALFNDHLCTGKGFYDRIPLMKLKTFSSMKKQIKVAVKNRECVLVAEHTLFNRMLFPASLRGLHMQDVLCRPLGPVPWALANYDGTPKKTDKTSLGRYLEAHNNHVEALPDDAVVLIDGMSLVQKLKAENLTFDMASKNLLKCLHCVPNGREYHVIFDDYRDISIKNMERERRATEKSITYSQIFPGHTIRGWKKMLCSSAIKKQLIQYFADGWATNAQRQKLMGDRAVYSCVTNGSRCHRISKYGKNLTNFKMLFKNCNIPYKPCKYLEVLQTCL